MMGKFAFLAALLVISVGAFSPLDDSDDQVPLELHGQHGIGHYVIDHPQWIAADDEDAARLHWVASPPQLERERDPPFTDPPKPGKPCHPGPRFTNLTIYEALSADEDYSKLVKLVNYDEDYVSFLNDTSQSVTFFAPNNHALTFPKHRKGRGGHPGLATLYEQFESLSTSLVGGDDDGEKKKKIKLILHAILQYHTLPKKVVRAALYFNTTFPTLLIAKDGSFGQQARRIGVNSHGPLPLGPLKINFYASVLPKELYTLNGVVYTVSRPLLPPPSIMDELFLAKHFFILTSALQKVGLDDWLSWRRKKGKDGLTEKGAVVTFFAPSDQAFRRLPPGLRRFLFSPFGAKALRKILSYHIVPDIILHTDFFYNATYTEDEIHEVHQWHEEVLHDTAALAFGPRLLGFKCKSHCKAPHELSEGPECLPSGRRPRFGLPTAGRLSRRKGETPCPERGQAGSPGDEKPTLCPPEHGPRPGPPDDRKPPHWPIPKIPHFPSATLNYSLLTVLESDLLNVTVTKPSLHHRHPEFEGLPVPESWWATDITKAPPATSAEHDEHGLPFPPLFKSSVTVNGRLTRLEVVARNGAIHTIGHLLHPFKGKKPDHGPCTDPEDDEWADWENWLPAWAEL